MAPGIVVEGALAQPFLPQQVEVDVGNHVLRAAREALRRREVYPVLVDGDLTVPCEIGGRLAGAGGRIDVGG